MDAPSTLRSAAADDEGIAITRRESDGETTLVVDFGEGADAKLDTVGETAIVVAGDRQFEFEIPPEVTDLSVNDGMLTLRS
ncbi:hypothetical protein [Halosimplex pelagicum]|uniref:Hsp20/alpha crystallin family protein n=1 Tax=Halosimplex pelagicum TaxID=869886 RepID=A0A7D5PCZ6_9EURY|nr:hypothetical protein [Halosimplex pelagicum]QLH82798.1 hypothetical protein HZS54_14725 [Halosimplex pelagicum]